jgi:hypothetical protein
MAISTERSITSAIFADDNPLPEALSDWPQSGEHNMEPV